MVPRILKEALGCLVEVTEVLEKVLRVLSEFLMVLRRFHVSLKMFQRCLIWLEFISVIFIRILEKVLGSEKTLWDLEEVLAVLNQVLWFSQEVIEVNHQVLWVPEEIPAFAEKVLSYFFRPLEPSQGPLIPSSTSETYSRIHGPFSSTIWTSRRTLLMFSKLCRTQGPHVSKYCEIFAAVLEFCCSKIIFSVRTRPHAEGFIASLLGKSSNCEQRSRDDDDNDEELFTAHYVETSYVTL